MAEKIPMIFIILLLPKLIPKYGKRNLIVSGCILGIVGQVMFLFNDTSVPLAIVSSVIRGIGMSPFYGVQYSLQVMRSNMDSGRPENELKGLCSHP